jgi:hypothetical protein
VNYLVKQKCKWGSKKNDQESEDYLVEKYCYFETFKYISTVLVVLSPLVAKLVGRQERTLIIHW